MLSVLRRRCSDLLTAASVVALAMACFYVIHANATVAAIMLLFAVLLAGAYAHRTQAVAASITATLCLDYFFIPPIGTISIAAPEGWIILCVFLAVSLVATDLSSRLRRQRNELGARQMESEKLHALSRAILLSTGGEDLRRLLVNKCIELFGLTETALFESATGEFYRSQILGSIPVDQLRATALDRTVQRAATPVDAPAHDDLTIIPVTLGNKTFGSFGFRGPALRDVAMQSLGTTIAIGLAQAQAQEAGFRAEAVRKSEELKSVMIDALAHELKTPLTAIDMAADMLGHTRNISVEQRDDLLEVIQEESRRLRRLMDEAIHLARIDGKRFRLERETVQVDELINAALQSIGDRLSGHTIKLELGSHVPALFVDRELMVQALKQLIDNAAKYSPARSSITITAAETSGLIAVSVRDRGQGLTELEQRRVFDKFYRARRDRSAIQGTGMGLSIAKEIAEAHGGSISVESQFGQGARFTITLSPAPVGEGVESLTSLNKPA
jgi:two-component system, OmpR family, sensor histidine kinase KdpD